MKNNFFVYFPGRYVLHPDYITESVRLGYFIDEAMYEWGNPANDYKSDDNIYKTPFLWRNKVTSDPKFKNGAFTEYRAVLNIKEDRAVMISNLIKCGGGTIGKGLLITFSSNFVDNYVVLQLKLEYHTKQIFLKSGAQLIVSAIETCYLRRM